MEAELKIAPDFELDPKILRAYDIRGVVGDGLDADACYAVGRAFGTMVI